MLAVLVGETYESSDLDKTARTMELVEKAFTQTAIVGARLVTAYTVAETPLRGPPLP